MIFRDRRLPAAAIGVVVFMTTLAVAGPDSAPVRMTFAWPKGTVLQVSGSATKKRGTTAENATLLRKSTYDYTLELEESDTGYVLIQTDRGSSIVAAVPSGRKPDKSQLDQVVMRLSKYPLRVRLSLDGAILGIEGLEELAKESQALAAELAGPESLKAAQMQPEELVSPQMLQQRASEEWATLVQGLRSAEIAVGETYEVKTLSSTTLPFVGPVDLEYRTTWTLKERTRCTPAEKASRCVVVEMESGPDAASLKSVFSKMTAKLANQSGKKLDAFQLDEFSLVQTATIVTDPLTLIPSRLSTRKTVRIGVTDGISKSAEAMVTESERTYVLRPAIPEGPPRKK